MVATNHQSLKSIQNGVKRLTYSIRNPAEKERKNKGDKIHKIRVAESLPELNQDNKSGERSAMNAQKVKFLKFTFRYIINLRIIREKKILKQVKEKIQITYKEPRIKLMRDSLIQQWKPEDSKVISLKF